MDKEATEHTRYWGGVALSIPCLINKVNKDFSLPLPAVDTVTSEALLRSALGWCQRRVSFPYGEPSADVIRENIHIPLPTPDRRTLLYLGELFQEVENARGRMSEDAMRALSREDKFSDCRWPVPLAPFNQDNAYQYLYGVLSVDVEGEPNVTFGRSLEKNPAWKGIVTDAAEGLQQGYSTRRAEILRVAENEPRLFIEKLAEANIHPTYWTERYTAFRVFQDAGFDATAADFTALFKRNKFRVAPSEGFNIECLLIGPQLDKPGASHGECLILPAIPAAFADIGLIGKLPAIVKDVRAWWQGFPLSRLSHVRHKGQEGAGRPPCEEARTFAAGSRTYDFYCQCKDAYYRRRHHEWENDARREDKPEPTPYTAKASFDRILRNDGIYPPKKSPKKSAE